ncbi:MAG: DUF4394 domain-containing protein [Pyrinomonadaceae bacterium]
MLSFFVFGIVAWQTKAQEGTKDTHVTDKKGAVEPENSDAYFIKAPDIDITSLPKRVTPLAPAVGVDLGAETEPNNTFATADVLTGSDVKIRGDVFGNGDLDWYSFTAMPGDRVYAGVMTSYSASASNDSQLRIFAADGTTLIEFDEDDGSLGGLSSTIAGATLAVGGTYYVQVKHFSATNTLRPYELYLRVQSGAPTPEVEVNDTPATANALPANGWVSGARNPAVATEQDWYSFTANAGDTIYLSLDLDPERDVTTWNGRLGIALFGDANNQILVVDDGGTVDTIDSEAMFMTVKTAGTYYAFVDSATAATGGPTATYNLSVSIIPKANVGINCTTYTSTNVPLPIADGALTSSTITVPATMGRIASTKVSINATHTLMADMDVNLRSPNSNDNGLFNDIGAAATGGQTMMDITLDQYSSGIPFVFTVVRPMVLKPELAYRLDWFDGENPSGVWTLDIRDDLVNATTGTLNGWSLEICELPPVLGTLIYSEDFEANNGGYTLGTVGQLANEWEYGTPATLATTTTNPVASIIGCNSGTMCWKTDLDNTYNVSSNQDLVSPNITFPATDGTATLTWAMRYQMESATFDHLRVVLNEVGGMGVSRTLWEWTGATMTTVVGAPTAVNIGGSAGWGIYQAKIDDVAGSLAGRTFNITFHVDSDTSINFAGVAIDDVQVRFVPLVAPGADLTITKTDGVTTAIPGQSVTYTIVASNAGPDPVTGATVADTFPASIVGATWTCVGAGGGTCTANGMGNINDTVNLPVNATVTYTVTAPIAANAFGSMSNTATVSSTQPDPNPANNSATDTDTLVPTADLSITKTDGVTTVNAGGTTTYTIVASNPGPSDAPNSLVTDTFPAAISSANWTCASAGGATCTAMGSGNISDFINLPAGSSVTYTVVANISASATGTLVNTASVATSGALSIIVVDPNQGNNSATDTDTIVPVGCQGGGNCTTDLAITKTDGVTQVTPLQNITYTIVASNNGPTAVNGAVVTDNFPTPALTNINWTCVGAGGATCPAGGSGNINALVALPVGGTATFTANATVAATATFAFSNTATIAPPTGATDPVPGNNSARDADAICSPAILAGYSVFNRHIVTFAANNPGVFLTSVPLMGLNQGEELVGIDFRPVNGVIYGVASQILNVGGGSSRVVTINHVTGQVTSVGSTINATSGFSSGIDFNPVPDRIREVDNFDNSRRLNPNDGTVAGTDTPLAYAMGDPNMGANPNVVHVAYTNSVNPAPTTTTLYGIDVDTNSLVIINPPNAGTLNTVGLLGVDPNTDGGGFDILGGTNTAYASLNIFGFSGLYTINLTTGAATFIGDIGVPLAPDGKGGPLIDGLTVINAGGCPTTAAGVTVSGRAFTPEGYGLRNAIVTITDSMGVNKTARTSSFGYYTFEGIEVGGTYVVTVSSKRYSFSPRTITVNDAVTDLDFIGTGQE